MTSWMEDSLTGPELEQIGGALPPLPPYQGQHARDELASEPEQLSTDPAAGTEGEPGPAGFLPLSGDLGELVGAAIGLRMLAKLDSSPGARPATPYKLHLSIHDAAGANLLVELDLTGLPSMLADSAGALLATFREEAEDGALSAP